MPRKRVPKAVEPATVPPELTALTEADPKLVAVFQALTTQQRRFLVEYVRTGNGAAAYRAAYNAKATTHVASVAGAATLATVGVAKFAEAMARRQLSDLLHVQKTFLEMSAANAQKWDAKKKKYVDTKTPDWGARKDGAEGLSRLHKLFAPTEINVTSKVQIVELPKKRPA